MLNSNKKCLIAYYSRKGNNYVDGKIKNLSVGNADIIANKIRNFTDGDLFEIKTVRPYPTDYNETTQIAHDELNDNDRPRIIKLC